MSELRSRSLREDVEALRDTMAARFKAEHSPGYKKYDLARMELDEILRNHPPEPGQPGAGQSESVADDEALSKMNGDLCDFYKRWVSDGDYLRCKNCRRAHLASYADKKFVHASGCPGNLSEDFPWQTLIRLLRPLYTTRAAPAVPSGYCIMPRPLTAENGAKALLIGDFSEPSLIHCASCTDEKFDPNCEECSGKVIYTEQIPLSWNTIKAIYKKAVDHFAAAPAMQEDWKLLPIEPSNDWAERYCALTNIDPDGSQTTFLRDGSVTITFREKAKSEIAAMLATAPEQQGGDKANVPD